MSRRRRGIACLGGGVSQGGGARTDHRRSAFILYVNIRYHANIQFKRPVRPQMPVRIRVHMCCVCVYVWERVRERGGELTRKKAPLNGAI